jgi:RNA polymerase sigma factor (sigma-70 family)
MGGLSKTDVKDLIILVRENDDNAFSEIVERYSPMIKKVISGFVCTDMTSEELFGESLVALHRAAISYNVESVDVSFGLYARICIYNKLLDYKEYVRSRSRNESSVDVERIAVSSGIQTRLEREETVSMLKACADEVLSEYERRVFSLCLAGYKTAEIAKILSKTPKSVDNAKARMLKSMRSRLDSISEL